VTRDARRRETSNRRARNRGAKEIAMQSKFGPFLATALAALAFVASAARAADPVTRRVLSLGEAQAVVAFAAGEARKNNAGGSIAVVDDGGHLLALERLDGTFPAAAPISIEKARSAAVFRKPTADFENAIKNGRVSLVANEQLLPLQGGVPIVAGGQVVGAIGVAGAASAQQDEDIAKAAAASFQ
jgi:glc operon protein GlcG